jgi:RNA recognition motif-containing protein
VGGRRGTNSKSKGWIESAIHQSTWENNWKSLETIMNTKVYVANTAAVTTENELMDLFSPYGNVVKVNVPNDGAGGWLRGFGCVTMATPEGARSATQALNGKVVGPGTLTVSEVPPREAGTGQLSLRRSPLRSSSHLY